MCAQLEVLKKIHEKGRVNGYDVELAEAQAKDYIRMDKKVEKIEKDINGIKQSMADFKIEQARQGGQIDLIVQRMNSPVDEERKDGIIWKELKSIAKNPMGKIFIILMIGCIALAGQRILELIGLIK
ncbi:MAG: hypothetical protein IKA10_04600 [Oscillospiraceae bacterium]|nr:hypothetical protein [Oscillospiraceae bacterium]